MRNKYTELKVIAFIFYLFGGLWFAGSVFVAIVVLSSPDNHGLFVSMNIWLVAVAWIIINAVIGAFISAVGEIITLFINVANDVERIKKDH